MIVNAKPSGILSLGRTGENQARSIRFDISHWVMDFGPGVVELVHQRSGDPYPYPVVVSQDGNYVTWNITATDTAMVGLGRCELRYYVGETLAKSETWMTKVFPALGPATETPPDPYQSWVDQALQAGAEAKEAADRAEEAAVRQPYPNAETGTWWVWDAESGAYADTGISYGTGTGGGGTSDHDKLLGRDKENQHPIRAITGLEDALAGKQPTGAYLTKETDPTVPAWAKAETKPSYTAPEVGADPAGTATARVSAHNTEATAHSDMRLLLQGLTDRLNALADSDDTTLDQLSEIVSYIKSNRKLIEAITTSKVSVADIIDNLTTNVANKPLSAAQGVALKAMIDAITIPTALPNPNALTFTGAVSGSYDGSAPLEVEIPSGGGASGDYIPNPSTASVGQTIVVKAVDEDGKPTEWEAVDMESRSDGWTEIGEITLDGTAFIISDYSDGVVTISPENGVYPQVDKDTVLRKSDYSAYINVRFIETGTEGQYTMVNLDGAVYAPSDDLSQYIVDIPNVNGGFGFSELPSFSYFKVELTTPLFPIHGFRSSILFGGKINYVIGTDYSSLADGPAEIVIESNESPVAGKDYVKISVKGKKQEDQMVMTPLIL